MKIARSKVCMIGSEPVRKRMRYTARLSLYQYMVKIPDNLFREWLVYSAPDGIKCIVIAGEKKTMIRDKNGYILETVNSLLPNGNLHSENNKTTILQGVYNRAMKTIYLVDLISWEDEMFVDHTAEYRLTVLITKLEENPFLGEILEQNELQLRVPQIAECTRQTLERAYYGLFTQFNTSAFSNEYKSLLNHVRSKELSRVLKITPEELVTEAGIMKLCASFAFDNRNVAYLKDGLVFVQKEGVYSFGYNEAILQWKDPLSSCYFDCLLRSPMVGYLFYNKEGKLVTHDGFIIEESIEGLQVNHTYAFSFDGIHLNDPYAVLENLKLYKSSPRLVWSSINDLLFKIIARRNMLPYKALEYQLLIQEASSNG